MSFYFGFKGAKLQMTIQNAISSKEVKIWLNPKYSFKIENDSNKGIYAFIYLFKIVLPMQP